MDLATALIGLTCILLCTLPFVLTSQNKRKNEKKLLLSLKSLAEQQHGKITQHEVSSKYAIGIDETKNFVFFQLKDDDELKPEFIDLSTVKNCKIVNIGISNTTAEREVEQLNLEFIPIDKNKINTILKFYDATISFQLSGEFESIEKWNELINHNLNSK
ncbi:hypothetical protein CW731_13035 [Polaribacter sp. ALD11]|uniref:hypothetical protein n=1 Tax=Polaribacter sp. ALD11 TaxID=2058137 RepID=UPI000C313C51|nr:hypothetical protein [Polaribacter sp. ALD11]AUC86149.1 hypothetical protein CW731_13035 [Polaribacter sp. ALD11]